ncbi:hypothetical protein P154DRAFT_579832 [Amniculicola lignicola CBS 123094]|uniref:Uncharacterized protein n=1 Tax=Amniculicola lignicola CBS 123094 TaxID=1392246 RepID=A0A6A5W6H5_9PLEO|nr:hypothetical protein P154DRAFT_579832 [Amniculicola lignicola CBS 123094]
MARAASTRGSRPHQHPPGSAAVGSGAAVDKRTRFKSLSLSASLLQRPPPPRVFRACSQLGAASGTRPPRRFPKFKHTAYHFMHMLGYNTPRYTAVCAVRLGSFAACIRPSAPSQPEPSKCASTRVAVLGSEPAHKTANSSRTAWGCRTSRWRPTADIEGYKEHAGAGLDDNRCTI